MAERIIITPLNWGLGHASRSIPIINKYIEKGDEVFIAANGDAYTFLKDRFPKLEFIKTPGYDIVYPRAFALFHWIKTIKNFLKFIEYEKKYFKKLIKDLKADKIISDNRYGAYSKDIPSFLICHQIFLPLKFRISFIDNEYFKLFNPFYKILIPDFKEGMTLSGKLSHLKKLDDKKFKFIGPLSRFNNNTYNVNNYENDYVSIISGPEPQKSILFDKLIKIFIDLNLKGVIVYNTNKKINLHKNDKLKVFCKLNDNELKEMILKSKIVISRSGYTTLMDLFVLKKDAILIPTPYQYEQIYLAKHYTQTFKQNIYIKQNSLTVKKLREVISKNYK